MSPSLPPDALLRLLLVDEDPVFSLGMSVWLNQTRDFSLVARAEQGEAALEILANQPRSGSIDLVLLDVSLGQADPGQIQGLNLCRLLRARYPSLPILVLSGAPEPVVLAAAQQSGANGYCAKTLEPAELMAIMRRVAASQPYWEMPAGSAPTQGFDPALGPGSGQPVVQPAQFSQPNQQPNQQLSQPVDPLWSPRPGPFASLRRNLRYSGLGQIDTVLGQVNTELQDLDLSLVDRAVLAGRQRELRVARWVVQKLLATPALDTSGVDLPRAAAGSASRPFAIGGSQFPAQPPARLQSGPSAPAAANTSPSGSAPNPADSPRSAAPAAITLAPSDSLAAVQTAQTLAFDTLLDKLQTSLINQTEQPLEIDILREDKKRELVYLVARKFDELLDELRFSRVEPEQLAPRQSLILLDLWQAVLVDFFGRYYTVRQGNEDLAVVEVLLADSAIVQTAILDKIPGVVELLQHFLFQTPLAVDGAAYPPGNPESLQRAELLLENLTLQVANAVMQPLLNHFANLETIKHSFYDQRLLSSRDVERFRNNLSWNYRLNRLYREPKEIFESQYHLLTLTGRSIKQTQIYAPRFTELDRLAGLPYVVTLALEARDAVAPRLRSLVAFVGNGFVYVLTEVVGRGIGLVGKGVLKGLGNVWQETKYGRDRSPR
ncbi:MAG: DUF3685 domain-containing protein [Elainella sp.]